MSEWALGNRMASHAKSKRVIKLLSPEQVNRALAEWLLAEMGWVVSSQCKVETQFSFNRQEKRFQSCRVDVEVV
jgi:hypothetical protein